MLMVQPPNLTAFNEAIKQIAEAVYRAIESDKKNGQWSHAILSVCFDRSGSSWISKIRVHTPHGINAAIKTSNDIELALIALNAMRATIFEHEWFGLQVNVDAERHCKINLNYDPRCFEDKTFYDS